MASVPSVADTQDSTASVPTPEDEVAHWGDPLVAIALDSPASVPALANKGSAEIYTDRCRWRRVLTRANFRGRLFLYHRRKVINENPQIAPELEPRP